MLTPPMLQNSSSLPVSPLKNSVRGGDADDAGQAAGVAGFSDVLAQEMNEKGDTPGAEAANDKTVLSNVLEGTAVAAEETETGNPEMPEDNTGMEVNGVLIGVVPQPIAPSGLLPGSTAARSPALTGNLADARADASTGGIANETRAGSAAEALQAEQRTTHAGFVAIQSGLFAGRSAATGTFQEPGAAPHHGTTPQNSKLSTDVSAADVWSDLLAKSGAKTRQLQATRAAIQNDMVAGQNAVPRLEFDVPKFPLSGETEKPGKLFLEVAHHNLPVTHMESAATAIIGERGPGPASASSAVAAGAPVHAAFGLEPRVGAAGWDNALGQKVIWMVSQQQQVAELTLNPPDLGPLQVVLSITDDQVSAAFVSQQADVRQVLEAALPRLKEMMADSGINLSSTTVSSDTPQQQRFEQQNRSGARYGGGEGRTAPGIDIGASRIHSTGNSLVDTFA